MPRRSRLLSAVTGFALAAAVLLLVLVDIHLPKTAFGIRFIIDDYKLVPFLLVIAAVAGYLNHCDARIPTGHCTKCGYDLTGVRTGRCPECRTPCYHWLDDKKLSRPNYCSHCGFDVREDHGPKCPSCGTVIA
jgi:predicted Zn-ribbon and HTH transcriptional regulator